MSIRARFLARRAAYGLGALAALAGLAAPAFAWGHVAHAMINKLAVDSLPDGPLKTFMKKHRDYIGDHAIDPDEYKKSHRKEEGPKHFLNIDEGGIKPEDYPRTWKAAVDKFGLQTALKNGKVPWAIQETFDDLVAAFKAKDGTKIVEKATWLGHYVGDAHQPFHAAANFDGQLTGQNKIHALFEEKMIEHNTDECEKEAVKLAGAIKVAEVSGDISAWAFDRVIQSNKLVAKILEVDKGNTGKGREKALWKGTGSIAEKRIAEAATGLAALWLTAYNRAGKPDLPADVKLGPGVAKTPGGDDHGSDEGGDAKGDPKSDPRSGGDMGAGKDKPVDPSSPAGTPDKPNDPSPDAPKKKAYVPSPNAVKGPFDGWKMHDDDNQPGAVVDEVTPGSNVSHSGIVAGDSVIATDGAPVNSVATLKQRCSDFKTGQTVPFTVLRDGAEHTFNVTIP